jgi:hypothetical protein
MSRRLAQVLFAEPSVDSSKLEDALQRQVIHGGTLGTNLLELDYITESELLSALVELSNIEGASKSDVDKIDQDLIQRFPRVLAESYHLIPYRLVDEYLEVLVPGELDAKLIDRASQRVGMPLRPRVTTEMRLHYAMAQFYGAVLLPRYKGLIAKIDGVLPVQPSEDVTTPPQDESLLSWEAPTLQPKPPARPRTISLNVKDIVANLAKAQNRDEIVQLLQQAMVTSFEYAALFSVQGHMIHGWRGVDASSTQKILDFQVSIELPTVFQTIYATEGHYLGPLPLNSANEQFLKALGRPPPRAALFAPMKIGSKLAVILYGDKGQAPISPRRVAALLVLLHRAGLAFQRILIKRRAEIMTPSQPPAAEQMPEQASEMPEPQTAEQVPEQASEMHEPPAAEQVPEQASEMHETQAAEQVPEQEPQMHETPAAEQVPEQEPQMHETPATQQVPEQEPQMHETPAAEQVPEQASEMHETQAAEQVPEQEPEMHEPQAAEQVPEQASEMHEPQEAEGMVNASGAQDLSDEPELNTRQEEEGVEAPPATLLAAWSNVIAATRNIDVEQERPQPSELIAQKPDRPDLEMLLDQLEDSNPDIRAASIEGICELGQVADEALTHRFPGALTWNPALAQAETRSFTESSGVLELLARRGSSVLAITLPFLDHKDPTKRFFAVYFYKEVICPEVIDALSRRLYDSEVYVRNMAMETLRSYTKHEAYHRIVEGVRAQLRLPVLEARLAAIQILGVLRDPVCVPQLIRTLVAPETQLVSLSKWALGMICGQDMGQNIPLWSQWWKQNYEKPRYLWLIDGLNNAGSGQRKVAHQELEALSSQSAPFPAEDSKQAHVENIEFWKKWWEQHTLESRQAS